MTSSVLHSGKTKLINEYQDFLCRKANLDDCQDFVSLITLSLEKINKKPSTKRLNPNLGTKRQALNRRPYFLTLTKETLIALSTYSKKVM